MADTFYKNFNAERFNSIEPEVCHLAFVAKVETIKESEVSHSFNFLLHNKMYLIIDIIISAFIYFDNLGIHICRLSYILGLS